jgi:hypothetical protein
MVVASISTHFYWLITFGTTFPNTAVTITAIVITVTVASVAINYDYFRSRGRSGS